MNNGLKLISLLTKTERSLKLWAEMFLRNMFFNDILIRNGLKKSD